MDFWHLRQASRVLGHGGIVAYPTEAVYGLGCDPRSQHAVVRLRKLKQRPAEKGFILIAAELSQLDPFIEFPSREVYKRVTETWPGPVTWVLPAHPGAPPWLRSPDSTLAVRVTAHPVAAALCRAAGCLISTSANPSGGRPARSAAVVRAYFADGVDYIVPGVVGRESKPTEIRDALTGSIIRPGAGP